MYRVKPIFAEDESVVVPTCMYKMKNLQEFHEVQNVPSENAEPAVHDDLKVPRSDLEIIEKQQGEIIKKLAGLKEKIETFRKLLQEPKIEDLITSTANLVVPLGIEQRDIVVYANPKLPPYTLIALNALWKKDTNLTIRNHCHSSLSVGVPLKLQRQFSLQAQAPSKPSDTCVSLIWKEVDTTNVVISPTNRTVLQGEMSLLRLLSHFGPNSCNLEGISAEIATAADHVLDLIHLLQHSFDKKLQAKLLKIEPRESGWLLSVYAPTIVDVGLWSYLKNRHPSDCPPHLQTWFNECEAMFCS